MKVLYITSKPIFPTIDGGCVAMERFLATLLRADIVVKHLLLETDKHQFKLSAYPDEIYQKTRAEHVKINTQVTPFGALGHLFKSGSYNIDRFYDSKMSALIQKCLSDEKYDSVIFDSLFTTPYLEEIRSAFNGKLYIRTHNVECDLWKGYAKEASGLKKWYLNRLAKDLEKYEMDTLSSIDGIFSISAIDSDRFADLGIKTPIHNISVAVENSKLEHDYSNNKPYHLGSMDWIPNQEAVERLIELIPQIRSSIPEMELHIAGLNAENYVKSNKEQGIVVHGFVKKIYSFGSEHGILVTPIQSGSGIRIKILEAMAIGIPVITTSIGAQGIDYHSSQCMMIADTDKEFVEGVIRLITDQGLREKIGSNAIDYIRKNHTINDISIKLLEILGGK